MEFNIDKLNDDELLIEFEVRDLVDKANQEVTQTMKEALIRKMEEEREDSFFIPKKPHQAAQKQPRREIEVCTKKLTQVRENVLQNLRNNVPVGDWLPGVRAKLTHIQGRVDRVSKSPKFFEMSEYLRNATQTFGEVAAKLRNGKLALVEAKTQLEGLVIEMPNTGVLITEREDPPRLDRNKGGPSKVAPQNKPPILQDLGDDQLEEFEFKINQLNLDYNEDTPLEEGAFETPHNSTKLDKLPIWNTIQLRQEAKTWKVQFQGMNSDLTVQRFLTRVEWHADRAGIPYDQLVRILDLCLEDEAFEWFWSTVDRNPGASWEQIKQAMVIRFSPSTTDDDILSLLNNRKQKYPRETVQEFYQAIQKIALRSNKTITDSTIYTVLRRNVRPGLQFALHDEQNFPNLPAYIRRCSALEGMWRRFGHNPEAGLARPNSNSPETYGFPNRRQVTFDPRTPRVHALSHGDSIGVGLEEDGDSYQVPGESECYDSHISAISNKSRILTSQLQPVMHQNTRSNFRKCWNCGEGSHNFIDCRRPITSVFCYGCGLKDTYKLDCKTCNPVGNWRTEMRNNREPHLGRDGPKLSAGTEEAASNTDPELYRMWRK